METNPLLLIDFYKACHSSQYPQGLTKMVSYYTPRLSRLEDVDKVCLFGLQAFIKEYLIEGLNTNFFNRDEFEVMQEYTHILNNTLGKDSYDANKIRKLHKLGYLPIEIRALPEGTRSAIGVPQIEISNTHPDFVWVVNTIETMLSCSLWHTQVSAEVGYRYRQIVNKYVNLTCSDDVQPKRMLGDFSMRGQHSVESAIKSSGAWCLSFLNTATVPAIKWLEKYYNCNCFYDEVAYGAISTEHSVMCSNFAVDGDEITHIKRLLTEIYPRQNFSMVSDSYDYNNLVENILPECYNEIMKHNGTLSIRGDSGDPIEIIAGLPYVNFKSLPRAVTWKDLKKSVEAVQDLFATVNEVVDEEHPGIIFYDGYYYRVTFKKYYERAIGRYITQIDKFDIINPTLNEMGTVWALWKIFGGTLNEKGYKVLNPHIKAIYGDSITPNRCETIYRRLMEKGFASNNCTLGVGSFSFMCLETNDGFQPYTRDTFGIAVKATYAEDDKGPIYIFKQPKALSWKKSPKGCCIVTSDGQHYVDNADWKEAKENGLISVFKDSKMLKEYSLNDVRNRLYNGEF